MSKLLKLLELLEIKGAVLVIVVSLETVDVVVCGGMKLKNSKKLRSRKSRSRKLVNARKRLLYSQQVEKYDLFAEKDDRSQSHQEYFEIFYKAQHILRDNEWPDFIASLRKPLPLSFRFNRHASSSFELRHCLDGATKMDIPMALYGKKEDLTSKDGSCTYLPWCDAWQFDATERELETREEWKGLSKWLANSTSLGVISRQEIVSMIPVIFLDVKPHHRVLDMCASPGSKTSQVLDILSSDPFGQGFVVANDADPKRAYTLVRRCAALGSACTKLMVTQHKAQKFPASCKQNNGSEEFQQYDRIVCDVPCCGDGTLRKSPDMWRRWHPGFAIGLHSLQIQIAMRGLSLLQVGGIMTYSTCTFNPIEDEAVVADLLRRCKGSVELLDVSDYFPALVRHPGLSKWEVFDDNMNIHQSFESCMRSPSLSGMTKHIFRRSMWPPSDSEEYPLYRCMRLYPQDQNTGGFFVAVIRKKATISIPRPRRCCRHQLPFFCYKKAVTSRTLTNIVTVFQLKDKFLKKYGDQLFSRTHDSVGVLTIIAPELRDHAFNEQKLCPFRIVSAGCKISERDGRGCSFRLSQEGCRLIAEYARQRILSIPAKALKMLLYNVGHFVTINRNVPEFDRIFQQLAKLKSGPCIIRCQLSGNIQRDSSEQSNNKKSVNYHTENRSNEAFLYSFYDSNGPRIKIAVLYGKGLELTPRATAQVYLSHLIQQKPSK
eukprot:gene5357-7108_t